MRSYRLDYVVTNYIIYIIIMFEDAGKQECWLKGLMFFSILFLLRLRFLYSFSFIFLWTLLLSLHKLFRGNHDFTAPPVPICEQDAHAHG